MKCSTCKIVYHVLCPNASTDQKVASKTTVTGFLSPSTKLNFKFFCDICLTKFEIDNTASESSRLNVLEEKFVNIESKLDNIVSSLSTRLNSPVVNPKVWDDKERTEKMKNLLVVKKLPDVDTKKVIEDIVLKNEIAMKNAFKSKQGNIVLECNSTKDSEKLESLVQTSEQNFDMRRPAPKMKSISVVGMQSQHSVEDFSNHFRNQNSSIRDLCDISEFTNHFKCRKVKALKKDESKFQAFCSVSDTVYAILKNLNYKVMIGLSSCKVYLQNSVPQCFNCQEHGHISKFCQSGPQCGKCAGDHKTSDCSSTIKKCLNCNKSSLPDNHRTFDNKCPTMIQINQSSKSTINSNLNL